MTADNIVLRYLRRIDEKIDRLTEELRDVKLRLGHVEKAVAEHAAQLAEINIRMDRFDVRLNRIEKRLDLAEV